MNAAALLLLLPAVSAQSPAFPPCEGGILDEDLRALVPRLEELMRAGLEVTEPNASVMKRVVGDSLFTGSYDWHSNVFAHWALLVIARTGGDEELRAQLLEKLTPKALERERALVNQLDSDKQFTFPYDQGWLLLLLSEVERHHDPVPESVRAFRLEVEGRLIAWLEESDFPENDDPQLLGGRRFVGFYRSWLFAWYQVRLSEPVGPGAVERLAKLKAERIDPVREGVNAHVDSHSMDFLWLPAVGVLIDDLAGGGSGLKYNVGEIFDLPRVVKLNTVHVLGIEISRLWGLAIAARDGDEEARELFHRRYREILARPDLWEEDFRVVTHWVPQFLWFGIWLADGRP
ncbi:MAG: DUF2891 family protein [Planctomycetota bacterium]|nr:DUF2891 family protein [Planctomycetota bacterium]